jgi:hypothetical protein
MVQINIAEQSGTYLFIRLLSPLINIAEQSAQIGRKQILCSRLARLHPAVRSSVPSAADPTISLLDDTHAAKTQEPS